MLYREEIAVCSQIHTKAHKYTVWAERSNLNLQHDVTQQPPAHKRLLFSPNFTSFYSITSRRDSDSLYTVAEIVQVQASTDSFPGHVQLSSGIRQYFDYTER
jgi:hypothetical protein